VTGAAQGVDASRVVYAFARDNALPGSRFWRQINPHTQTPVNAVWIVMVRETRASNIFPHLLRGGDNLTDVTFSRLALEFVACLGSLRQLYPLSLGASSRSVICSACSSPNYILSFSSASVIGLYLSYAAPIFLRITSGRDKFIPGPFQLGAWAVPIGTVACLWVSFITTLLVFPASSHPGVKGMSE
jgi:amino acid transporter